jgi:hypothetical protein
VHINTNSLRNLIKKQDTVIETNDKILRMIDSIGQKRDTHVEGVKAMLQKNEGDGRGLSERGDAVQCRCGLGGGAPECVRYAKIRTMRKEPLTATLSTIILPYRSRTCPSAPITLWA